MLQYIKDVATVKLSVDQCIGCGRCKEVCPHGVFTIEDKKARIINKDRCMECGACALNCPAKAIEVNPGVGCAAAYIKSWFTGGEPTCDCNGGDCC